MMRRGLWLAVLALPACTGGGETDDDVDLGDLVGILVTPEDPVVPVGGEVHLKATGLFEDRTTTDLTAVVDWESDEPSVVEVSAGLDQEGLLTGVAVGEAHITASTEGILSSDVNVRVTDAELLGITVDPKEIVVAQGERAQLTATAAWSDGSRGDASAQVRWVTDDGNVVTMDAGGVLDAVGIGRTEVHAEWEAAVSNDVAVDVIQGTDERANLEVEQVTVEAGGGWGVVTVKLRNTGGRGASDFFVDLFVDPASAPQIGDYADRYSHIDYVGPTGHATLSFEVDLSDGDHEIYVLLDSGATVDEGDEQDNLWSDVFAVGGGAGGPNLTITYFDWLQDDTSIYYAIDVYNAGSEPAPEFFIDLFLDQPHAPVTRTDGDEYVRVDGLGAGQTTSADFLLGRTCPSCTSWILVDSYDSVPETDESDNIAGPIHVGDQGGWDTGYGY